MVQLTPRKFRGHVSDTVLKKGEIEPALYLAEDILCSISGFVEKRQWQWPKGRQPQDILGEITRIAILYGYVAS